MFLNNSDKTNNLQTQNQEPNKLVYLNSNISDDDDDEINISELLRVFRRRGLIIIGTTLTLVTALSTWILLQPPVYEGKFKLLVEPLNSEGKKLDFLDNFSKPSYFDSGLDYDSQIDVLKSPLVMDTIFPVIQSRYPELVKKEFMSQLNLERFGETKILEVSYTDESEEEILFVLNQLMKGYLDYQSKEYISNITQAQAFAERSNKSSS